MVDGIARFALDRTAIGKAFEAIDKFDDAIRLVADETRQRTVLGACALFQQLRR